MTSKDNIIYYTITAVIFIGVVVYSLLFYNAGQPANGDSERENISTIVSAVSPFLTATATIVLALITWRYVRLTDSLLKATYKPEIVVYLRLYRKPNTSMTVYGMNICVENVGSGVARHVVFGGDVCYRIGKYICLNSADFISHGIDALAPGHKKEHNLINLMGVVSEKRSEPVVITVTYKDSMNGDHDGEFTLDFNDRTVVD